MQCNAIRTLPTTVMLKMTVADGADGLNYVVTRIGRPLLSGSPGNYNANLSLTNSRSRENRMRALPSCAYRINFQVPQALPLRRLCDKWPATDARIQVKRPRREQNTYVSIVEIRAIQETGPKTS